MRTTLNLAGDPPPVADAGPATPRLGPRPPLELVGGRRDDARLLVATASDLAVATARMADLPSFLDPGDVLVVNTSATLPAAVVVDRKLVVHLSTELGHGTWVIELRHRAGHGSTPWLGYRPDGPIELPGGGAIEVVEPYMPDGRVPAGGTTRLWTARLSLPCEVPRYLDLHGRPIRYGEDAGPWPLTAYQTVFAAEAGSAEMPSAARGFTPELVTRLVSQGVVIAPLLLHTGVASQEVGEPPYPERFRVPAVTAGAINTAVTSGRRVIAVGTTATRALESATRRNGTVVPREGWTDLVISPERGLRVVDGLLTGWHDPEASHLHLVEAVAGREVLDRSYQAAVAARFAGHEFGDFHLILP